MVRLKNIRFWNISPVIAGIFLILTLSSCGEEVRYAKASDPILSPIPTQPTPPTSIPTLTPSLIPTPTAAPLVVPTEIPLPVPTPRKSELLPASDFTNHVSDDTIGTGQRWSMSFPKRWTPRRVGSLSRPHPTHEVGYARLYPDIEEPEGDLAKMKDSLDVHVPRYKEDPCIRPIKADSIDSTLSILAKCDSISIGSTLGLMDLIGHPVMSWPYDLIWALNKEYSWDDHVDFHFEYSSTKALPQILFWITDHQSTDIDFNATIWMSSLFQQSAINLLLYVAPMPNVGGYPGYWDQPITTSTQGYHPMKSVTITVEEFHPHLPVEPWPQSCCNEDRKALRTAFGIPTRDLVLQNIGFRAYVDGYNPVSSVLHDINGIEMIELKQEFTKAGQCKSTSRLVSFYRGNSISCDKISKRLQVDLLQEYYFSIGDIQYRVYGTAKTQDRFLLEDNLEYMINTFKVISK